MSCVACFAVVAAAAAAAAFKRANDEKKCVVAEKEKKPQKKKFFGPLVVVVGLLDYAIARRSQLPRASQRDFSCFFFFCIANYDLQAKADHFCSSHRHLV